MQVYNTLTRHKEEFVPLHDNRVSMYACGVTVYDLCHLGHARSLVVFDVIYRYLRFKGYDVTYVRNFTDVDDKIINRANERNITWRELAETYIREFYTDMDRLQLERPTMEPRATDHIDDIIALVRTLEVKGLAYAVDGDVYFRVTAFPGYGKLSGKNTADLLSGARIEVDDRKESPLDFALWKKSKPGEPAWDSPWGPGRPGWHIECSAMSQRLLGATFDIHGGGKDLVFPHHENEIAQSEAATGKPFVRYWLHNGFVNIDKEKMSKSLGNFHTIRDVLERYHPEALRLFILSSHYRSPIDFSWELLDGATAGLERLYEAGARLWPEGETAPETEGKTALPAAIEPVMEHRLEAADAGTARTAATKSLSARIAACTEAFTTAMDDDFNTAQAVAVLFDAAREINRFCDRQPPEEADRQAALTGFLRLAGVLGIVQHKPAAFFRREHDSAEITAAEIEEFIARRRRARTEKNWAEADRIRDHLAACGVILKDSPQGTDWQRKR
ncbi:MAG: cysteine--tRNA ligase [Deltaproteobacteria bacterium]|nr:cysteine--tRNA ligase [Candidatus Anaeroferrophillacea bacterium]